MRRAERGADGVVSSASRLLCSRAMTWRTRGILNRRAQKTLRKKLRNSTTSAEAVLWTWLQGRKILGKKFRRQVGFGRYIVDFYCPEARLGVELDGAAHFSGSRQEYEQERTR